MQRLRVGSFSRFRQRARRIALATCLVALVAVPSRANDDEGWSTWYANWASYHTDWADYFGTIASWYGWWDDANSAQYYDELAEQQSSDANWYSDYDLPASGEDSSYDGSAESTGDED